MNPSVTLSACDHARVPSPRKSAADYHTANASLQLHLEPASSEVISNLITSLSDMSTEQSHRSVQSPITSVNVNTHSISVGNSNGRLDSRSQPSGRYERDYVIRERPTNSQPSSDLDIDYSSCSHHEKNLLTANSRTASKDSNVKERKSIGNLSVVSAQTHSESRVKLPDARDKKQRRIIYKSSLEKLRNKELERRKKTKDSNDDRPTFEPSSSAVNKTISSELKSTSNNLVNKAMGSSKFTLESCGKHDSYIEKGSLNEATKDSLPVTSENYGGLLANASNISSAHAMENYTSSLAFKPDKARKNNYPKESGAHVSERIYSNHRNRLSISTSSPVNIGSSRLSYNGRISIDERSSSIESIDEAVEAYLCAPRLSQKIRHPLTGRIISFSEVGDPEGFAVFCCVGMGLTRYVTAFYDELALSLKLRLITPDRPGVGDSEPYNDGTTTPLSWPDDIYTICQFLRITKFSILAHSAGAIYALATALRMPQHIRGRIHLLAPWIPPSQMSVVGGRVGLPPNSSIPTSQRILRVLPTTILKAANSSFISATSNSLTSSISKQRKSKRKSIGREAIAASARNTLSSGIEEEILRRNGSLFLETSNTNVNQNEDVQLNSEAEILAAAAYSLATKERQVNYESRLTHAIWNYATQGANPAVDLLVCLERRHTIGFRYVDITRAVVIHHGSKDTRVPLENVLWMGKTMKRCEVNVLEGEGHSLMASASVMSSILTEIAREWEDWMRLTASTVAHRNEGIRRNLIERASIGAFR